MDTKILIVEDELGIQELLKLSLTQAGYRVWIADGAEQAQHQINTMLPDLILLDWMLPKTSGIEFAKQLRANPRTRTLPIIMLTARSEEQDKVLGLETGADDYLTKPFSPRELLARIKAVLRRHAPQRTDDTVKAGGLTLDPNTHRVNAGEVVLEMAPTEFRILHFFMTHPERVYSRAQLLDQIWGDHIFVEERTIDVHIRRLRCALEPANLEHYVQTVRGLGYRFSTKSEETGVQ